MVLSATPYQGAKLSLASCVGLVVYPMYAGTHGPGGVMSRHVSAREARAKFAELTDRVRYTGEPIIVEKQGQPFVAVVSLEDLARIDRLRRDERMNEFSRLAARAAEET